MDRYDETITLPRAVKFPVELVVPDGFDPERIPTWPTVVGRLEFFDGRLLYTPPCGDDQGDTVTDLVIVLGAWVRAHPGFVLGTNEAGMRLRGATRAADAAIWRTQDATPRTGGLRRKPPLLAVEVAGREEPESALRKKASWYLDCGVAVVWLVLPASREVVRITREKETRCQADQRIPPHAELPGLEPLVREVFLQLEGDPGPPA